MSINCHRISKSFKNKVLFKEMNVSFEKGLCHCIVGENGAGKTTLLRMIAGLEKADEGTISYLGNCTYSGSSPYMLSGTVRENIMYPLKLRRQTRRSYAVEYQRILEMLGLHDFADKDARLLSSGEKQKVALGRAIVWQPDILLLDEPTANIDTAFKANIEQILKTFVDETGATLLMVSHEMAQASRLSSSIWRFESHKLTRD